MPSKCFLDCIINAQSVQADAVRAAIVHPGAANTGFTTCKSYCDMRY